MSDALGVAGVERGWVRACVLARVPAVTFPDRSTGWRTGSYSAGGHSRIGSWQGVTQLAGALIFALGLVPPKAAAPARFRGRNDCSKRELRSQPGRT